jgi:hypothetical protein
MYKEIFKEKRFLIEGDFDEISNNQMISLIESMGG